MRTWIKLYTEILRDPKMGRLTDREYRTCVNLFLLAGAIDEDGRLGSTEDIAWQLRMTEENTAADLVVLRDLGIIALNGDVGEEWHVTHFEKRQARPPSAEPEAVTERVQRYRANLKRGCNEDVTSLQRGETPSEADPDPDQIQTSIRSRTDADQEPEFA